MAIESASTIRQFISTYQRQGIKEPDFWFHGELSDSVMNTIVPEDLIIENYTYELNKYKIKYTLNAEDFRKYKYNPARLSNDLYDTCEYAWLLLFINEMYSEAEFNKENIYILKPAAIRLLTEIMAVTNDLKSINESEMFSLRESVKITTPEY